MANKDYLIVDRFLQNEIGARALRFALRIGLIDSLEKRGCSSGQVPVGNPAGRKMLLDLLAAQGVIDIDGEHLELTPLFRSVLAFRDLLEAKIEFTENIARDIALNFDALISDLPRFMETSETFKLFRYDRCFDATPENVAMTRRWMRLTTALTRYEGRVLAERLDLRDVDRLVDVGGNSGELALQLCAFHPHLHVTVFDLPVVCRIGLEHTKARPGADRVTFVQGDVRREDLPAGAAAITFKSVLHDWPDDHVAKMLQKAVLALAPGGRLVIFERCPWQAGDGLGYAQWSNLVFFHFFRPASFYMEALRKLGCHSVACETIRLEMDFHLVTARKAD